MQITATPRTIPRLERIELNDGLIMRWSTSADKENIAQCLAEAFRYELFGRNVPEGERPGKNDDLIAATNRCMSGEHVVSSVYDFAIVENTTFRGQPGKNPVVAAIALHQFAGYYGSVDLNYGVMSVVGTVPEYRNRGLIKKLLLQLVHPAAEERGDLVVLIPGIPHFYRQFGYEYAIPHKACRMLRDAASSVPTLDEDASEPFALREATSADIPYLVRLSNRENLQFNAQIGTHYDHAFWRFVIEVITPNKVETYHDVHHHACIIVDTKTGKDIGISLSSMAVGRWTLEAFTIDEGQDVIVYREVVASVLRQLKTNDRPHFESYNTKLNNNVLPEESEMEKRKRGQFPAYSYKDLLLALPPAHPIMRLFDGQEKLDAPGPAFTLYTRIADLPKFIRKVAPVLERRLKESVLQGSSSKLQINFYRKMEGMSGRGLEIVLEKGKILDVSDWTPLSAEEAFAEDREKSLRAKTGEDKERPKRVMRASIAPLTFLRIVTGSMAIAELLARDSENFVQDAEAKMMLDILFPKVEHFVDIFWW
ncbi:hypothetical protein BGZ70_010552 [Mortierella alpina]|uniref:N-acetyltransferase domain-containing protein n=1 Tax=Mortierella alpina TaxID=64518 RepID=A0A9P6IZD4_MORAP|nr:hypothetical protein BGZ70_010552 [Mortierella alpina]